METWKTKLDMVRCEICGKPYVPVKQFEIIQAKLGKQMPLEKICPMCLRLRTVERLGVAGANKISVL